MTISPSTAKSTTARDDRRCAARLETLSWWSPSWVAAASAADVAVEGAFRGTWTPPQRPSRLRALYVVAASFIAAAVVLFGFLGTLAEPADAPGSTEFLDIIVEEVDRLNRVVSSFLDYARPSSGDPIPTEINGVVQRTVQLLSPDLGDVETKLELSESLPRVRIDAERLRQVLINLGQNAAQAMEGRGELMVRTGSRWLREPTGERRRWVELEVVDTGPGIPERVRQNLFVPFVTTKDRGTGLGLAISQRIVNTAGGDIEVRSAEGVGTTFVVRLPAVEESEATGPVSPAQKASISNGRKSSSTTPAPSPPAPSPPVPDLDAGGEVALLDEHGARGPQDLALAL